MTEILYRWMDEELRIPVPRNADDFLKVFSNGQMLGKILKVEGLLPDKKFDQLRSNDLYEDRLHNFLVIGPYMKMLGVNLSVRQAREILADTPGSLTHLIYQVYLALHGPRGQLQLRSAEPLSDDYRQRLLAAAKPDRQHCRLHSLTLTCQCYGQQVVQTRLAEAHYVKECQQRISGEAVTKKENAKNIEQQMTDEYMKGDSAILWGRTFSSSVKPAWQREQERKRVDAAAINSQICAFEDDAENRQSKFQDVRNAQFLQTTVTPDMIPDNLLNAEANQQFIHKLRLQRERDSKARFDREKRRKQMYLSLRDEQRRQERERREMDLVRRLLRQADYELRLAAHLADIKRIKQIVVQNRLEKDQQMQERRQDEYERSIQLRMELLSQKRMEHQDQLEKEAQLHRRLLSSRRAESQQGHRLICLEVVEFCIDLAVLIVEYKTTTGDQEVPKGMWNDWRQLFIRGENLLPDTEPEELNATSAFNDSQQRLLQEQDFLDYMNVSGEWTTPEHDSAKSRKTAQSKDEALRLESLVVTGFVVHRLLRLVYPQKQPILAPERPNFTLTAAAIGKSYAGKTQCLKSLENCLGIYHIEVHQLIRRALMALENETQLEAAGSSIMETLKIGGEEENEADKDTEREEKAALVDGPKKVDPESSKSTRSAQIDNMGESKSEDPETLAGPNQEGTTKESASQSAFKTEEKATEYMKPLHVKGTMEDKSTPPASAHVNKPRSNTATSALVDSEQSQLPVSETIDPHGVTSEMPEEVTQSMPDVTTSYSQLSRFAELGMEAKEALDSGRKVSDNTIAALILEAWRELPEESGWIIEGFPNSIKQAQLLESLLIGKSYDLDEEMEEIEIEVHPLPKPEPPPKPSKSKGKNKEKKKTDKKGKKTKEPETPPEPSSPPLPPPAPEPVYTRVKPFRRSRLVPDTDRCERPQSTSGLDLVVELVVSDEVAEKRRCRLHDDVEAQPDSANYADPTDEHVLLAGKLFGYGALRQPLEDFYTERGVFQQINAERPLQEVGEQLVELIQVNGERREESRLREQQRRALLDAAENAPDSEPEPEPDPEPDTDKKGKGKRAAKEKAKKKAKPASAQAGKAVPAAKNGKSGKKGRAEPEPEPEPTGPIIPPPPPLPKPSEPGYYFVDAPVPPEVSSCLALTWQQMENGYIAGMQRWLGKIRQERSAVVQHLSAVRNSFNAFLLRPDHKQQLLDRYVEEYNRLHSSLVCDEEVKCEWHLRIKELEEAIWNITDKRRCEAEQERFAVLTSGWIEDRLALSANNWLMAMQAETDRFQDTSLVLEDYFISMNGAQLPEAESRPKPFKQGLIEIPQREPVSRSMASSAGSDGRHSGTRSGSSSKGQRKTAPVVTADPAEPPGSDGAVVSTITVPQLRPRLTFQRGKNQSEEITTAVEGVIESAYKAMLSYVHDCRDKGEARVRAVLHPGSEDKHRQSKDKKPAKTTKPKGRGKAAAVPVENEAQAAAALARQEQIDRSLAEYQTGSREETARVAARLAVLRQRALAELQGARQRAIATFQLMWGVIGEQYQREVAAAGHMADYLRSAVERQQKLHYGLILDQDRFLVRTGVLTHLPCLPASPPPPTEQLQPDYFSLDQVAFLWRELHRAAPSGTVTTKAFCFILQDLVVCGVNAQELPEEWMSLTQSEIERLAARLAYGAEVLSWRGLVYDLLEPWSRPDQYDIHEAVLMAHAFDKERSGYISRGQAQQVVHWIKPHWSSGEDRERVHTAKRQLIAVSGAPGSDVVHYPSLLTWLCRSRHLLNSFLCALTIVEERPVFITSPEDDARYFNRSRVDLERMQSLPHHGPTTPPIGNWTPTQLRHMRSEPTLQLATEEDQGSEPEHAATRRRQTPSRSDIDNDPTGEQAQDQLTPEPTSPVAVGSSPSVVDTEQPSRSAEPPDSKKTRPDSAAVMFESQSIESAPLGSGVKQSSSGFRAEQNESGSGIKRHSIASDGRPEPVEVNEDTSPIKQGSSELAVRQDTSGSAVKKGSAGSGVRENSSGSRRSGSGVRRGHCGSGSRSSMRGTRSGGGAGAKASENVQRSGSDVDPSGSAARQTVTARDVLSGANSNAPEHDDEPRQASVIAEITIPQSSGFNLDSWTELGPSCCTHPSTAPGTPSSQIPTARDTGNRTTLNNVRMVLANTLIVPRELLPAALERLDLDLSLVYRDLNGGGCCEVVEALRVGRPLAVPILAVLEHPALGRYLGGHSTLLSGDPWQVLHEIRRDDGPPAAEGSTATPSPPAATLGRTPAASRPHSAVTN